MTSYDVFTPEKISRKTDIPDRIRTNSQGSTYSFPARSPSPTKDNHHPYAVKTTSTGLLTRSNSNASTPFTQHSYSPLVSPSAPSRTSRPRARTTVHRYSKSLSSANEMFQMPPPLPSPAPHTLSRSSSTSRSEDDNGLKLGRHIPSSDSDSVLAKAHHIETLPSLFKPKSPPPIVTLDNYDALAKALSIPQNPKYWSPTNLSLYIGTVLSTKRGGPLPDNVLRDIQIYLIREKINGRQFMRFSEEDMDDWSIDSLARAELMGQAQELRQRAIKGRIYGFEQRASSPSKLSNDGGSAVGSLASSPQSDDTCEESSEADDQPPSSTPGWLGRAVLPNKSPRGLTAPSSRFSTPSRRSLGRLTNAEHRGRVKGMIESFEHSGRSREGSISSDFSSPGEEKRQLEETTHDVFTAAQIDAEELPVQADDEDEIVEADVTITSPVVFSEELPHLEEIAVYSDSEEEHPLEVDSNDLFNTDQATYGELQEGSDDLNEASNSPRMPQFITPLSEEDFSEPSIEQLLDNVDEAEGYTASHPWEEDVVGETARRVPVVATSLRRSSAQHSRQSGSLGLKGTEPVVPLTALFTPISDNGALFDEEHVSVLQSNSATNHTAPPSYSDHSVEADLADLENDLAIQQEDRHADSSSSPQPDVMAMLESFRVRLAEVEQKLDQMEQREAQRALAEQEEAIRLREMTKAPIDVMPAQESATPIVDPAPTIQPTFPALAPEVAAHKVSVGVSTDSPEREVAKHISPSKIRIPKNLRQTPPSDFIPEGIPQFILGASLGIVVVVVRSILRRYSGRRS